MHLLPLGTHFSSCIVRDLYDVLSGLIEGFLMNIFVQPVRGPQVFNCSLDMAHIHQTTPHNLTFSWLIINNNVQLWVW